MKMGGTPWAAASNWTTLEQPIPDSSSADETAPHDTIARAVSEVRAAPAAPIFSAHFHRAARHMPSRPAKSLQTFPNPAPQRDYRIHMEIPEFTCVCPMTGQPDFATLVLDYVPDRACVELKSLKLYIWSYRDEGAFHEAVTNRILGDLAKATK